MISVFITIFSTGLFIVSITSYRKYKNVKLLVVSIVFIVFLIKGILLSIALVFEDFELLTTYLSYGLFDLIILTLLFVATLKR